MNKSPHFHSQAQSVQVWSIWEKRMLEVLLLDMAARLECAEEQVDKPNAFWNNIIWSQFTRRKKTLPVRRGPPFPQSVVEAR